MENVSAETLQRLIILVGHGDHTAFQRLYDLSSSQLFSFAWRFARSREAAEEIVQESYLGIWRSASRFDRLRSAPMTWMLTIVRYKALDYLRAEKQYRSQLEDSVHGEQFDCAIGPDLRMEFAQQIITIRRELGLLPALQRKVIELAFFGQFSHSEVAFELSIPLGTVKTRIRRGCATLRKRIEPYAHKAAPAEVARAGS